MNIEVRNNELFNTPGIPFTFLPKQIHYSRYSVGRTSTDGKWIEIIEEYRGKTSRKGWIPSESVTVEGENFYLICGEEAVRKVKRAAITFGGYRTEAFSKMPPEYREAWKAQGHEFSLRQLFELNEIGFVHFHDMEVMTMNTRISFSEFDKDTLLELMWEAYEGDVRITAAAIEAVEQDNPSVRGVVEEFMEEIRGGEFDMWGLDGIAQRLEWLSSQIEEALNNSNSEDIVGDWNCIWCLEPIKVVWHCQTGEVWVLEDHKCSECLIEEGDDLGIILSQEEAEEILLGNN